MDERHKKLIQDGDKLFADRKDLDSLWQDVALHFYPEMATFTTKRSLGEELADHLATSYPLIARRTLGDSLSALLRPVNLDTTSPGVWFSVATENVEKQDNDARKWLEWATATQRRAMYDKKANFVRATKEGDHSFATFGQCIIQVTLNRFRDTLLYRSWHLKDFIWSENAEGEIDHMQRKWEPTASQLVGVFGNRTSSKVRDIVKEEPYKPFPCRHVVIAAENYEQRDPFGERIRTPWVSIWIDVDNNHVMEEIGTHHKQYVIPRWVTIPGSQYASSPAVTAALPDARLIQAMTVTLLEAAEKYADPPVLATEEAIRSDINLFSGGVTYVDSAYDGKLENALRPAYHHQTGQGTALGLEMRQDVRESIARAFFLDSLSLPPADVREMTAFEVGQRISEWIRRAMPIFEPMEFEYNGSVCEETFNLLLRNGAFGSMNDLPQSLRGADVQFKFESPIHESADRKKGQKFLEAQSILLQAAQTDPSVMPMINARDALRDALQGVGAPAEWLRSDRELDEIEQSRQERQEALQSVGEASAGSEIARNIGSAVKDFAQAGGTQAA